MEEPGNMGMATGWAINCVVTVCCRGSLVVGQKMVCEHSGVQVTGAVLL